MAAEGMLFPFRWNGGTISLNLGAIWGMSDKDKRRPDMSAAWRPTGAAGGWHSTPRLTMRKPAALILVFLWLGGCAPSVERWVEQVTLGGEYYASRGKVSARWVKTPKLSVFGATSEQHEVVASTLAHLNDTLANTPINRIELINPNDRSADIVVYFARLGKFHDLAKWHGFKYVEGNWGYFYAFSRGRIINGAIVLLASDKLRGNLLRHFTLEEITQSLGLFNDSWVFSESIFYAGRSNTQHLSELDKKLIIFLYKHIQPGSNRRDVRVVFKKYWKDE